MQLGFSTLYDVDICVCCDLGTVATKIVCNGRRATN